MSTIGTRIRELRVARGLTQTALAGEGISAGYVSLIESGKRTPSTDATERLAARLGVPVEQLLGDDHRAAADQAHADVNFARLALANGNPAEALHTLERVDFGALDTRPACDAALVLAESLQETGQLDRAVSTLESLISRCRREQAWVTLAIASTTLSVMYLEYGDVNRALLTAEAAMTEIEGFGLTGTDEHIRLGSTLVAAAYECGDLLYATRRAEELIKIADRVGSTRARGSIYWNAGLVAHGRGRMDDAIRLTDRAVALIGEQEESRDLPRLRQHYAWLLLNRRVPLAEEALEQLDRAERDPALAGGRLDSGSVATLRGRAHLILGDLEDAAEHAAGALQLLGASDHVNRVSALLLLGDVGVARFDEELARDAFAETARVLAQMKESRVVAHLWRELGDSLRDWGDVEGAARAFDTSLEMIGLTKRPAARRLAHAHAS